MNLKGKNNSELGKGAFGVVKLVISRIDGKAYAMKTINKRNLLDYSSTTHLKREIKI
jgi:serine/threonine protein kinase